MAKPILDAARQLLKLKDGTTYSEIASVAGVPRKRALEVLNRNGHMVYRHRKTGKITRIDTHSAMSKRLWESGKFYRESQYDWGSRTGYVFEGNDALKESLQVKTYGGGLGDSYAFSFIPATPENRQAIEAAGMRPWSEAIIDDSDWNEDIAA